MTKKNCVILINSDDNWESVRDKFRSKMELKKKRSYCKFYLECSGFCKDSYACTHNGKSNCGKYRSFMSKKKNKQTNKKELMNYGIDRND